MAPYRRHPIESLLGIGPDWGDALRDLGYSATEDLLAVPPSRVVGDLSRLSGFPAGKVSQFLSVSELLQVDGLDVHHASTLGDLGIGSLYSLVVQDPEYLAEALRKTAAPSPKEFQDTVDAGTVAGWQRHAGLLISGGSLRGRIASLDAPLAGALIVGAHVSAIADSEGRFWLPGVPLGVVEVLVSAAGHVSRRCALHVLPVKRLLPDYRLGLTPGAETVVELSEKDGQMIRSFRAGDEIDVKNASLETVSEGEPLVFGGVYANGDARLASGWRSRSGNIVSVARYRVPAQAIALPAEEGDLFIWRDGFAERDGRTLLDYRLEQLHASLLEAGATFELGPPLSVES